MPAERERPPVCLNIDPLPAAPLCTPNAGGLQAEAGYLRNLESNFVCVLQHAKQPGEPVSLKRCPTIHPGRGMHQSSPPGVMVPREIQPYLIIMACCITLHVQVQAVRYVPKEVVGSNMPAYCSIHFKGCRLSMCRFNI